MFILVKGGDIGYLGRKYEHPQISVALLLCYQSLGLAYNSHLLASACTIKQYNFPDVEPSQSQW